MKQPKKLTRQIKEAVTTYGLNAENWMLLKDGYTYVTNIHKASGKTRIIDKFAIPKKGVGKW